FKRFVRDHPNIYVRRVRTADHLRAFLAEHGTPAAKAVFARALREVDAPAGTVVARHVAMALDDGEERSAIAAIEALIRRVDGAPEGDEVRLLRRQLDDFVIDLKKVGRLDALARALERHAAETARRYPGVELYDLGAQITDLATRFGSSQAQAAWAAAR